MVVGPVADTAALRPISSPSFLDSRRLSLAFRGRPVAVVLAVEFAVAGTFRCRPTTQSLDGWRRNSPCRVPRPRWLPECRERGAVNLVGPAVRIPPTNSSASSVVVVLRTPAKIPSEISPSIASPPVPVAWNTDTRSPHDSRSSTCSTHGVVTRNIVAAINGRSETLESACTGRCVPTIPAMARAALPTPFG